MFQLNIPFMNALSVEDALLVSGWQITKYFIILVLYGYTG